MWQHFLDLIFLISDRVMSKEIIAPHLEMNEFSYRERVILTTTGCPAIFKNGNNKIT